MIAGRVNRRRQAIIHYLQERQKKGKHFTLIVAAEGAKPAGAQQENREARLGGIGAVVAAEIEKRTGKETRLSLAKCAASRENWKRMWPASPAQLTRNC
jgi:6-phosphofructokinase